MKSMFTLLFALLVGSTSNVFPQAASPQGGSKSPTAAAPVVHLSPEAVNADLKIARADNQDKRFADAESLMLQVTAGQPEFPLPWLELGAAQIGLKKYAEAETSFKTALGIEPASSKPSPEAGFYAAPDSPGAVAPSATRASRNTMGGTVVNGQNRTPEVLGAGYSSLGEIYIRTGRTPEAQAAFDAAVKAFPSQAALYRRNETILFFQVGNTDAQLDAAEKAIAVDPSRAMLYFFKGQALATKATVDSQTQKMVLPPGSAEALRKYLSLEPAGQFAKEAKGILAAASDTAAGSKK